MATSGTTVFQARRADVIRMAYVQLNVLEESEAPTTEQIRHGADLLNAMQAEWQAEGIRLWKVERLATATVASTVSYTLAQDVVDVIDDEFVLRVDGIDYPMKNLTRQEYVKQIANKLTQAGRPYSVWVEPNVPVVSGAKTYQGGFRLYPWPVPDAVYSVIGSVVKRLADFSAETQDPDFPTKWTMALIYGLAYELSFSSPVSANRQERIKQRRDEAKRTARNDDNERGGIRIGVDLMGY